MKPKWSDPRVFALCAIFFTLVPKAWATSEMDIDADLLSASGTATPVFQSKSEPAPTASVVMAATVLPSPTVMAKELPLEVSPEPGQGVLKMQTVYKVGISYYQKQDFAKAIRYLKESLDIHDPYTPKFYYAEANAMLGVIYQFHIIDRSLAHYYYQEALDIDPTTATAKKHIGEVSDEATK